MISARRPAIALPLLALTFAACTGPAEETPLEDAPTVGTLAITLDDETTEFTPEVVRCEGEPDALAHLELRAAEGEFPLIEVVPDEFAMVKLVAEGEPEKNERGTDGITAQDAAVAFADAEIGDAVVSGTVDCPTGSEG